ncbi:MAG: LysR family transcriptional regulator [Gammaproteobacteria bacterium]|nr:LysR family transcriptional regulator [Gammaproteobacteria bacterium]
MKHILPSLEALKVFESDARHLSFSLAAEELCLSKGAVSYQIKKLEQEIRSQLFDRNIRQVELTESGKRLHSTTKNIFDELRSALSDITRQTNTHDVSIAATTYVAARWLSPRVSSFSEKHPDISIIFHHSVNAEDFNLNDVDIAIHWGRCDGIANENVLLEIPMAMFPVGNPSIKTRLGSSVRHPIKKNITLLCEDRKEDLWQLWSNGRYDLDKNPRRYISDANVRVQATIDGQGIMLADEMMRNELTSGSLLPLSPHELRGFGYVIKTTTTRQLNPEANKLKDWLVG